MIMRQGSWYIERYDTETGGRNWWVELSEEWTWSITDATSYDTIHSAKNAYICNGFKDKDGKYTYKIKYMITG